MRAWARAAGLSEVRITSSSWTYADAAACRWWGHSQADRISGRAFTEQALGVGASREDVADIARHLHRELAGAKSPDAITSAYLDRPAPVSRQRRSRAPREAAPPAARQQPRGRQTSRPPSAPTWSAGRFVVTAVRKLMSLALRLLFVAMLVGIGIAALQAASEAYLDRVSTQSP